ncbi:MAG: hypothetical protein ACXVCP_09165 [Bdellovibrio sp.]
MKNKLILQIVMALQTGLAFAGPVKAKNLGDVFKSNAQSNQVFTQTSDLLTRFGFSADYVNKIDAHSDASKTATEKQLMQDSKQRFELLNISRDLSAYILTQWQKRTDSVEKENDLHKLVAELLKMKLVTLPRLTAETGMEVNQAVSQKIEELVQLDTKAQVIEILSAAYGKKVAEEKIRNGQLASEVNIISEMMAKYNQIRYNYLEISQTPYLGKALLVAMINHYQKNNMLASLQALNSKLINDPKIAQDGFSILTAKINNEILKPMDIVATWSDRINTFYQSKKWNLPTLKSLLRNAPALKDKDYNQFASVICLPSPEDCLDASPLKLKIHWLVEAPVLPAGGLRIVDMNAFAPTGFSPRLSYVRWEPKSGVALRNEKSNRQSSIGDFVYGNLVESTSLNPPFTSLGVALALSAFEPNKMSALKPKIVEDKLRFQVNSTVLENAFTSEAWVPTVSQTVVNAIKVPPFHLRETSLGVIRTMPQVGAVISKMEKNLKDVNPKLVRSTIQCIPAKNAVKATPEGIKEFLYKIGFGDQYKGQWLPYTEIMNNYNKNKVTYNEMTRRQQVRNVVDYQKVQASVELATMIAMSLSQCEMNEDFVQRASALAATLASFEAPAAIIENPLTLKDAPEDENVKPGHENPEQRARYEKSLRAKMASETNKLVKLILDSLYGSQVPQLAKQPNFNAQVKNIQKLSQSVIELAFMNHQIGRTRFLGRAVIALLLRQAKLNGHYDLAWNGLSEVLNQNQMALENFVGDKWKIRSMDKKYQAYEDTVPVYNMSYLYTRGINMESPTIPSGAIPGGDQNATAKNPSPYYYGKQMGLVGNFAAAAFVPSAESTFDTMNRWKDKKFYTTFNDGYSHVGYAVIREADGIKMSWVIDNYPTPIADMEVDLTGIPYNPGGIRISGLEQFYRVDHHSRLAVAHMVNNLPASDSSVSDADYYKFFEYAKRQVKGFIKNHYSFKNSGKALHFSAYPNFKVYSPILSEEGKPLRNTETKQKFMEDPWLVEISSQDFMKMHKIVFDAVTSNVNPSREQIKEWFDKVNKTALDKVYDLMYKGVTFVWITPYGQYFKGGAYCSLTGVLGWKLGTGLDLEEVEDGWHSIVHMVNKQKDLLLSQVGSDPDTAAQVQNVAMMADMPIVSPSGLAAQTYNRIQDVKSFVPPYQELADRFRRQFGREIQIKVDPAVNTYLGNFEPQVEEYFEDTPLDFTEVEALYNDTLEIAIAAKGCTQKNSVCGRSKTSPE